MLQYGRVYGFGAAAHPSAKLARQQAREVLAFMRAGDMRAQVEHGEVVTRVTRYPLHGANRAPDDLRAGRIEGAAVLVP